MSSDSRFFVRTTWIVFIVGLICVLRVDAQRPAWSIAPTLGVSQEADSSDQDEQGAAGETEPDEEATEPEQASESPPPKRAVTPEDYGRWESLSSFSVRLSPNGQWIAYTVSRINGENELRTRMLATEETKSYDYGTAHRFSGDSRWLGFLIGVSTDERESLQKQDKPVHNKLGLLNLADGELDEIEDVSSFTFSDDGQFVVMRRYANDGRDIVLRDLSTGVDTSFGNVSSYAFNDDGTLLAMTITTEGKTGNGVQVYDAANGRLRTLDSDDAKYKSLTWREDAADLAVLREMDHEEDEDVSHVVLAWYDLADDQPLRQEYDHTEDKTFPETMRLTDLTPLRFSDDGETLFFGIKEWENKPKALDAEEEGDDEAEDGEADDDEAEAETDETAEDDGEQATTSPDEADEADEDSDDDNDDGKSETLRETLKDPSNVEVWHAADIDIIPRQKKTESQDKRRTHLAAWWPAEGRFVQLGDDLTENVATLETQKLAIGADNTPYEDEKRFGPTVNDLYIIGVETGEKTKVLERVKYRYGSDPTGRYFLFVRDNDIWSFDTMTGAEVDLTSGVDSSFINDEISALTDEKPPYGITGWTDDGRFVLLNDKHDIWMVKADGSDAWRVTDGAEDDLRARRIIFDFEEDQFITLGEPMYLTISDQMTRRSGLARVTIQEPTNDRGPVRSPVESLMLKDKNVGGLARAEDEPVYTFVEMGFDDSPDIFVDGPDLDDPRQVSETNPFQSDYLWGRSEIITFTNTHGEELPAALHYPAGYEPGKSYPMIVYIYERTSPAVHRYVSPSERSAYNATVWTAEGYVVLRPDIVYRPQNPGLSAVECVVPAVNKVIEMGVADRDRIGLVGHSWGAYQTAFIVTQTDLFAAGVAGAPLTNMMSMSMSIYWNSGQADAWIFHESQGRMDRPFWQDVDTYIKNSPIFSIDDLETPLMIAFGTEDGAVDFNQGVELYNAARLAQKDFVMLVYPGENHGLRRKENQVDYHYRVLEWFGHYVKGDPAPAWISEGQTWLDRQKEIEAMNEDKDKKDK